MTMTINKPQVDIFRSETLGVESAYVHNLTFEGEGTDDKGSFTITGVLQEVRA